MANHKHEAPIYCFPNTHTAEFKGHKSFCKCVVDIFFHQLSTSIKKNMNQRNNEEDAECGQRI